MKSATKALGEYIFNTTYDKLPEDVIRDTKSRIADLIGIGLSGSKTDAAKIESFCHAKGGSGAATIWGIGKKTTPEYAALANGTMTFHLELDDVHRTSHTHPGVSCIPTAIALCEEKHLSGKELIEAVVVGYDAGIRIGLAVSPSIYVDRTHLAPGTLSAFSASASASKLMGLSAETAGKALAAVSYYGPTACYESFKLGAGIKDMIMGWGNLCGIYSANLAALGCGGPDTALEGAFGFCKTVSDRFDIERLYNRLGSYYEIVFTGVKPYACCRQHHAAVDCMLALKAKYGFGLRDVKRVLVRTFVVSSRGNSKTVDSVPAAKYSIPYIMGVALRYGKVWREQFSDELLKDNELIDFSSIVDVEPDYELDKLYDEKWPSIVEVTLKDGRMLSERRDLPKGEPEFACTPDEIKDKFMSLSSDALTEDRASKLWDMIGNLEDVTDINELTALMVSDR